MVDTINNTGLSVSNLDQTRSNRIFNRYLIPYESNYENQSKVKSNVVIEIAYQEKSYPVERKQVTSVLHDYLLSKNATDIIQRYQLETLEIYVQSYIRTFIDKIFAVADYAISNQFDQHSRHLYDLHKLNSMICMDEKFKELFLQVKVERNNNKKCVSASSWKLLFKTLDEIIEKKLYENDYEIYTNQLIYDECDYSTVIATFKTIVLNLKSMMNSERYNE